MGNPTDGILPQWPEMWGWLQDHHTLQPIQVFHSVADLKEKLKKSNFTKIREEMRAANALAREEIINAWLINLDRLGLLSEKNKNTSLHSPHNGSKSEYVDAVQRNWPLHWPPEANQSLPCDPECTWDYMGASHNLEREYCTLINTSYVLRRIQEYAKVVGLDIGLDSQELSSENKNITYPGFPGLKLPWPPDKHPPANNSLEREFYMRFSLDPKLRCTEAQLQAIVTDAKNMMAMKT